MAPSKKQSLVKDSWVFLVTAIISFGIGTILSGPTATFDLQEDLQEDALQYPSLPTSTRHGRPLNEQMQAQYQFQSWILQQQQDRVTNFPRNLRYSIDTDMAWIELIEAFARALKVALVTERRLVLDFGGDDEFCNDDRNLIFCRWNAKHSQVRQPNLAEQTMSPLRQGIISNANSSDFFNVHFYGSKASVDLPSWPWRKSWLLDTLDWERQWGSFWVRSQILYYLIKDELDAKEEKIDSTQAVVVLVLDAKAETILQERFGRNASKTQHDLKSLLAIANHLRYSNMADIFSMSSSWTFCTVNLSPLNTPTLAGANFSGWKVLTVNDPDNKQALTVLQRADFLIGSFSSPWFRVATGLNLAFHNSKHHITKRRHWGLDIEWLEGI